MIDWQEILPVVAFIVYMIFQRLFSNKEEGEESSSDNYTPEERARQIKEEIKRRIQQRQQSSQPQPQQPVGQNIQTAETPLFNRTLLPIRPEYNQTQFQQPDPYQSVPRFEQEQYTEYEMRPDDTAEHIIPDYQTEENIDIEALLLEKQKLLAKEKIKKELVKRKSRLRQSALGKGIKQDYGIGSMKGLIRALKNPDNARNAFIYSEIIGTPVGSKTRKNYRPLWEA